MPRKDKLSAKSKGVGKPSPGEFIKRRHVPGVVVNKKDLQRILERSDIDIELHRGMLVIRRKADNRILRLKKTPRGIQVVDPTTASRPKPLLPGIISTPAELPELSGLRKSRPVPRVPQPAGTEPEPPKAKPEKKPRWFGK